MYQTLKKNTSLMDLFANIILALLNLQKKLKTTNFRMLKEFVLISFIKPDVRKT